MALSPSVQAIVDKLKMRENSSFSALRLDQIALANEDVKKLVQGELRNGTTREERLKEALDEANEEIARLDARLNKLAEAYNATEGNEDERNQLADQIAQQLASRDAIENVGTVLKQQISVAQQEAATAQANAQVNVRSANQPQTQPTHQLKPGVTPNDIKKEFLAFCRERNLTTGVNFEFDAQKNIITVTFPTPAEAAEFNQRLLAKQAITPNATAPGPSPNPAPGKNTNAEEFQPEILRLARKMKLERRGETLDKDAPHRGQIGTVLQNTSDEIGNIRADQKLNPQQKMAAINESLKNAEREINHIFREAAQQRTSMNVGAAGQAQRQPTHQLARDITPSAIEDQLREFAQEEGIDKGVSFKFDQKTNTITVTFPTQEAADKFTQRLVANDSVTAPRSGAVEGAADAAGSRPRPSSRRTEDDQELQQQQQEERNARMRPAPPGS